MNAKQWCEENGIEEVHYVAVEVILDQLDDEELAAQVNALGAKFDPRPVKGWEKIKSLYRETEGEQVPSMIAAHESIVFAIAGPRLEAALGDGNADVPAS